MSEKTPVQTKKPYEKPVLVEHGDIRVITQTTGNNGHQDNPSGNNHRTH